MARGLCYADAVRLLGGRDSKAVMALDRLTDGLLLAASATGAGFALNLFEPKSQLVRLSADLVRGLRDRVSGLSRFGRSERLAAKTGRRGREAVSRRIRKNRDDSDDTSRGHQYYGDLPSGLSIAIPKPGSSRLQ